MTGICEGRVVIVTGAARGSAGEHALELARQGAKSSSTTSAPARRRGRPPTRPARSSRRSSPPAARPSSTATTSPTGRRPALVSRRDRGVRPARCGREQCRHPARPHVRERLDRGVGRDHARPSARALLCHPARVRALARPLEGRRAGLGADREHELRRGAAGQRRPEQLRAAKAGIAALTLVQAVELARYGVTANAIAPSARTRLTEKVFPDMMAGRRRDST